MSTLQLKSQLRLDRLAIWVDDIEKTAAFFTNIIGWKRHPMEIDIDEPSVGVMKATLIAGNGLWLELVQPISEGPGMDILKEKGNGAFIEFDIEALGSDYDKILDTMESDGVEMLGMDGSPLVNGGLIAEGIEGEAEDIGLRIAYWPTDLTGGTPIELYSRDMDDKTNVLNVRDKMWEGQKPDPRTPRINHCCVIVKDLQKTTKFYQNIMGWQLSPENFDLTEEDEKVGKLKINYVYTNNEGVWLELVQPVGPGPVMDYLTEQGEGCIAEIAIEVEDLGAYYDKMKAIGIQLLDIDWEPLSDEHKYQVLPDGDKIAYFPSDVACGMVIELIERTSKETGILSRLYARSLE